MKRRRFIVRAGGVPAGVSAAAAVTRIVMARKVHASFTRFQALVGRWDHVAEAAYHQLVAA